MIAILIACAGPEGYAPSLHHCQPASPQCQQAYAQGQVQYRDAHGVTHVCPLSKAPLRLRGAPPKPVEDDPPGKGGEH